MNRVIVIKSVVLALIVSVAVASPALAYVDPNTGGMLFQILAAAFVFLSAILLFLSSQIRIGFARVRRFLRDLLSH